MTIIVPIMIGVLGAAVGSFLNVVIHRVPAGLSVVRPPSACPTCSARVRFYDNVPVVSWFVLRGRCRDCSASISMRYPLVELVTALVFAGIAAWKLPDVVAAPGAGAVAGETLVLLALLVFAASSIALTAIDLDTHRLPNVIVVPTLVLLAALLGASALLTGNGENAARAAAAAGILFAGYFVLALISPRGMGMGDVKLAAVIGLMLGWFGWAALAVGAFAAFLLGGLVGMGLIIARRASRSSGIPFGPWMLGGAWVGILLGEPIARGYLALFGWQ